MPASRDDIVVAHYRLRTVSGTINDDVFSQFCEIDQNNEKAAKKKDAAGSYAIGALSTLHKHLETAQSLSPGNKTANPTANRSAVIAVPAPAAGVPPPTPETKGGDKAQ